MFANCEEGNVAEGDRAKVTEVSIGKNYTGDNLRIHTMIGPPMICIGFQGTGRELAQSRFGGGTVSRRVTHHQVWPETGIRTRKDFMLEANLLDDRSLIRVLPIQELTFNLIKQSLYLFG